jgi:hypothetical protein
MVLSRADQENLQRRLQNIVPKADFEKWAFDGRLLDAFKQLNFPSEVIDAVTESAKDPNCTKQFWHLEPQLETIAEFLSEEKPSARYTNNCRAARVLLMKSMPKAELSFRDLDDNAINLISNKNGSPGAIASGTKLNSWDKIMEYTRMIDSLIHSDKEFCDIFIPTMPFHRSQISNVMKDGHYNPEFKYKDRLIEGVDGATCVYEATHGYDVYQTFKTKWVNYAGGKNPLDLRQTIWEWRSLRYWLGTDFSKFDMHLPSWLLEMCFDILREQYFPNLSKDEIKEWKWIEYNFIHTHMITPDLRVVAKHKGIPSGSFFTQIIGTMANLLMQLTGLAAVSGCRSVHEKVSWVEEMIYNHHRREFMMIGMGDDCLLFFNRSINESFVRAHCQAITNIFGVEVKFEKSDWGSFREDPLFLKREWRSNGEFQDPASMMINVIHNERARTYEGYNPWHIILGLKLTYSESFSYGVTLGAITKKMKQEGITLEGIRHIPMEAMPGVFRGLGDNPGDLLFRWVEPYFS